jgi:hypothetical protein
LIKGHVELPVEVFEHGIRADNLLLQSQLRLFILHLFGCLCVHFFLFLALFIIINHGGEACVLGTYTGLVGDDVRDAFC